MSATIISFPRALAEAQARANFEALLAVYRQARPTGPDLGAWRNICQVIAAIPFRYPGRHLAKGGRA
jgi:hypothetical protein